MCSNLETSLFIDHSVLPICLARHTRYINFRVLSNQISFVVEREYSKNSKNHHIETSDRIHEALILEQYMEMTRTPNSVRKLQLLINMANDKLSSYVLSVIHSPVVVVKRREYLWSRCLRYLSRKKVQPGRHRKVFNLETQRTICGFLYLFIHV